MKKICFALILLAMFSCYKVNASGPLDCKKFCHKDSLSGIFAWMDTHDPKCPPGTQCVMDNPNALCNDARRWEEEDGSCEHNPDVKLCQCSCFKIEANFDFSKDGDGNDIPLNDDGIIIDIQKERMNFDTGEMEETSCSELGTSHANFPGDVVKCTGYTAEDVQAWLDRHDAIDQGLPVGEPPTKKDGKWQCEDYNPMPTGGPPQ